MSNGHHASRSPFHGTGGTPDTWNPCYYCERDQCCTDCCAANYSAPAARGACETACLKWAWRGDCATGSYGNCWRYAISCQLATPVAFGQPGYWTPGHNLWPGEFGSSGWLPTDVPPCGSCDILNAAIMLDGPIIGLWPTSGPSTCPTYAYTIFAVIDPPGPVGSNRRGCDFHFFRQHPDGSWTDKAGCTPVVGPRPLPTLPFTGGGPNPFIYSVPCGFYCVPYDFTCEPP